MSEPVWRGLNILSGMLLVLALRVLFFCVLGLAYSLHMACTVRCCNAVNRGTQRLQDQSDKCYMLSLVEVEGFFENYEL